MCGWMDYTFNQLVTDQIVALLLSVRVHELENDRVVDHRLNSIITIQTNTRLLQRPLYITLNLGSLVSITGVCCDDYFRR